MLIKEIKDSVLRIEDILERSQSLYDALKTEYDARRKFATPYLRPPEVAEFNSGEKVTDSSDFIDNKTQYYRILSGGVISNPYFNKAFYDTEKEFTGDSQKDFDSVNVQDFNDDDVDITDIHNIITDIEERVKNAEMMIRKRELEEYEESIISKYKDKLKTADLTQENLPPLAKGSGGNFVEKSASSS